MSTISRRSFLRAALAASAAAGGPAFGQSALTPSTSPLPLPRPDAIRRSAIPTGRELIARAGLGGDVGYVVADMATGVVLEAVNPTRALPPASSAKAITTAYALDLLGADHRFHTRLIATGPIADGRLDGDLWLVGGGDPLLTTDGLQDMVRELVEDVGLREVTGRFRVSHGALPFVDQIDPAQPQHVGYNPSISGLNLNFNRVHFQWVRDGGGYTVTMDARSETLRPPVRLARMEIADRSTPVYTYVQDGLTERWTVARSALTDAGSRWLPVRHPHIYAGEVFQTLAGEAGLQLSAPLATDAAPEDGATPLVDRQSAPLEDILRGMMRWSTNLTAEVAGLSATRAAGRHPRALIASARQMNNWTREALEPQRPRFVDHSGLGDGSRISAADMARAMVNAGQSGALRSLMRAVPMRNAAGEPADDHPMQVVAKTGTLNFVSALAGYATHRPTGTDLGFAIFCGDLDRRAALRPEERDRPDGARSYNRRAKNLQQALIDRWGAIYGDLAQ